MIEASYAPIHEAICVLVKRGIQSGDMGRDIDAVNLLKALVVVAFMVSSPVRQPGDGRLVDILISGSRPAKYGKRQI